MSLLHLIYMQGSMGLMSYTILVSHDYICTWWWKENESTITNTNDTTYRMCYTV